MEYNNALVSVIVRTYNQQPLFLKESLKGVMNQTYQNFELIIADDSTEKDSIDFINSFASTDNRITVLRKPYRMGLSNSFNEAFKLCKGEYIALLDDDDVPYLNRLELQLQYAADNPSVDVFGGDMDIIDENGIIVSERKYPTSPLSIKLMFIFRSPFSQPTLMFKRRVIDEGYMYNPSYKRAEDIDFLLRLYGGGYRFGNIGKKILKYRVQGNLQNKRRKDQWVYNHKARTDNFIWRMPFFSSASWFVSFVYKFIPSSMVKKFYSFENKKKV